MNYLRQHPISGTAPDSDGIPLATTVDVSQLFLLMTNLGNSPISYRDLDAAARAWLESHDALPLLRLSAEYDTPFVSDAVDFSYGQYQDLVCQEYPLHYDLAATPAQRRVQYDNAIEAARQNRPDLFAPFTIDEALDSNANFTPLATCLDWPTPLPAYPQGDALPANPVFPAVPTLVLSGDLDSVTSVEDADQVTELFPNAVHLVVPNLTHVTAWYYIDSGILPDGGDTTHCVQDVVRRFVSQLSTGDTSCIPKVRPIRTVPRFERSVAALKPAEATSGNVANAGKLRLASGALETVGDVFSRFLITYGSGSGLRGGNYTYGRERFEIRIPAEPREMDGRPRGQRHDAVVLVIRQRHGERDAAAGREEHRQSQHCVERPQEQRDRDAHRDDQRRCRAGETHCALRQGRTSETASSTEPAGRSSGRSIAGSAVRSLASSIPPRL